MPAPLSEEDVRKVARLSKLRLSDAQVAQEQQRLAGVLEYMQRLSNLPLDGVEPLTHAGDLNNVLRTDEPGATLSPSLLEELAPASQRFQSEPVDPNSAENDDSDQGEQIFISVPRVLGGS